MLSSPASLDPAVAKVPESKEESSEAVESGPGPDWILVIDVEATCEDGKAFNFFNEIIELPCILLNRNGDKVAEFFTHVRPTLNPRLTAYCTRLTGVTQAQVDGAPTWPKALEQFEAWLIAQGVADKDMLDPKVTSAEIECRRNKVLIACDGPWDVRDFLRRSCDLDHIPTPFYFKRFVDLRKYTQDTVYRSYNERRGGLDGLLAYWGLTFQGRPHSGLDDSRNIARVVQKMVAHGYVLGANWERTSKSGHRHLQMLKKDLVWQRGREWAIGADGQ
ncbi:ribonuclease H-like domain-containing protein [Catenaria anguillulae PL171]|uniref:Ribonuclease H-like domain-containing protein n=1 Tax=Catenaria anguillulae PL171 TaxID=765915 RepID=A0A1Y2HY13_9FUNG|nr:ribonuclease H-like domain-containing protein [Catenaria anguillulae PL171]